MEPKNPHEALVPRGFPVKYQTLSGDDVAYANALLHTEVGTRHALISTQTHARTGQVFTVVRVDPLKRRLYTQPLAEFGYCADGKFRPLVTDKYGQQTADPKHFLNVSRALHPLAPLKFIVHPPSDTELRPLRGEPLVVDSRSSQEETWLPTKVELELEEEEDPALRVREMAQAAARFEVMSQMSSGTHVVGL